jgi:hypothetical protein
MAKDASHVSVEPVGSSQAPTADYELTPYHAVPAYNNEEAVKQGTLEPEITAVSTPDNVSDSFDKIDDPDHIIVTGADAAAHLLPLRDDGDPSVTFRGIFLASCLSAFQAVMNQIYTVSHGHKGQN